MSSNQFDLQQMMESARNMQNSMQAAQEELANTPYTGESGGGMVKLTMTGRHEAIRLIIDPSLINSGDEDELNALEDLIIAAINDTNLRIDKDSQEKILGLTKGLGNIDGLGSGLEGLLDNNEDKDK